MKKVGNLFQPTKTDTNSKAVAIVYLYPMDDPSTFTPCAERWVNTYRQFTPGFPHDLHICFCNGVVKRDHRRIFDGLCFTEHSFNGPGWDIGAYQFMARGLTDYPFAIFMNARAHFWKEGWLQRLMEARDACFDPNGLYACSTSFEACPIRNSNGTNANPHVRTACFGTNPRTFNRYPYIVDSRDKGFLFESGTWKLCQWYEDMGYKVAMVLWDGIYYKQDWRKPANIFRRGDQSNLLVCDRHTDLYKNMTPTGRIPWEKAADTGSSA